MNKLKVLWIGDAVIQSGFSVVTHNICNELVDKCDLAVLGIGYDGRTRYPSNFHIYPAKNGTNLYSPDFAAQLIVKEEPDIVVLFNDLSVIDGYIKAFDKINNQSRIVPMFPINMLPMDRNIVTSFTTRGIKYAMTYTDFSKSKVVESNPNLSVYSLYHGVDRGTYFPVANVKEDLGLKNLFIVGNVNSNTSRKRLDLFIEGFAKFAKDKSDVRCLVHSSNRDIAYELSSVAEYYGIINKIISSTKLVTVEKMNMIYNTMDVNTNTSVGEGFGLSLLEGAACGIPILCPDNGNMRDIWTKGADFINIDHKEFIAGTRFVGDIIDTNDMAEKLNRFYEDREYLSKKKDEVADFCKGARFDWKVVADKVFDVLSIANKDRVNIIS